MILTDCLFAALELTESTDGLRRANLLITRGDFVNANKRCYPMSIWQREVPKAHKRILEGRFTGLADHGSTLDGPSLLNTVLKFEDVQIKGREVWGRAVIIPTSKGLDVIEIAKAGVQIGVSTVGSGSTKTVANYRDPDGRTHATVEMVNDDYKWEGADLVLRPSEQAARLHLEHLAEQDTGDADGPIAVYLVERLRGHAGPGFWLVWDQLKHCRSVAEINGRWQGALSEAMDILAGGAVPGGRAIMAEQITDRDQPPEKDEHAEAVREVHKSAGLITE